MMQRLLILSVVLIAFSRLAAAEPIDLARGPQLFIDDALIVDVRAVNKVTEHPKRHLEGPILGYQQHTTQPYVTVIRDEQTGKFRMWYNYDLGENTSIAYAESSDGVKWECPKLGILGPDNRVLKIGRSKDHGSYGVSVIDDGAREKDASRRFKMMWWSGTTEPAGIAVAFSPDGIRWTQHAKNPVLPYYETSHPRAGDGIGDIVDTFYDPIRQRYGALFKLHGVEADGWVAGPRAGKAYRRLIGASFSHDFERWAQPWRVIVPEARDEGLLEFYSAGGTIARGGLLISFVRMLHDDYSPEPGGDATGIGYTTLATSRDGVRWRRHDDIFFDRNPQPGTWDRAMTWVGCALPVGEEIFLYYGGYARGHKVEPSKERQIGLVKIPLDRFVAMHAAGEGSVLTVPLRVPATFNGFVINANAAGGAIRAQVQDEMGEPIPGLTFGECQAVDGDGIALALSWKTDARQLAGKVIQLKFQLNNAKLYGFDVK